MSWLACFMVMFIMFRFTKVYHAENCLGIATNHYILKQVSWSLTQECRSVRTTNHRHHQLLCASVRDCITGMPTTDAAEGHSSAARLQAPKPPPHQPHAAAPENRSGHEINTSTNSNSDSPTSIGINASTRVDCITNGDDINHGKVASSSWELRQHFPIDALVPRASPTRLLTDPSTLAKTTAQNDSRAGMTAASVIMNNTFLAQGNSIERQEPETVTPTRPMSSDSRTSATETDVGRTPTRVCTRSHTVGTGLQDMDTAQAGVMGRGIKHMQNTKNTTLETRAGFYTAPGEEDIKVSAEATVNQDNESRAVKIQQVGGGIVGCLEKKIPPWMQPHCGAPWGQAKAEGGAGLTAELLKSPGVALNRSGRVAVVEQVM